MSKHFAFWSITLLALGALVGVGIHTAQADDSGKNVQFSRVSCTTTATALPVINAKQILVMAAAAGVYLGDGSVTATDDYPAIAANAGITLNKSTTAGLYCITASGTVKAQIVAER